MKRQLALVKVTGTGAVRSTDLGLFLNGRLIYTASSDSVSAEVAENLHRELGIANNLTPETIEHTVESLSNWETVTHDLRDLGKLVPPADYTGMGKGPFEVKFQNAPYLMTSPIFETFNTIDDYLLHIDRTRSHGSNWATISIYNAQGELEYGTLKPNGEVSVIPIRRDDRQGQYKDYTLHESSAYKAALQRFKIRLKPKLAS